MKKIILKKGFWFYTYDEKGNKLPIIDKKKLTSADKALEKLKNSRKFTFDKRTANILMINNNISEIKIGRNTDNDIIFDSLDVSRDHCEIIKHNGGWAIIDKKSINGTYIKEGLLGKWTKLANNVPVQIPNKIKLRLSHNIIMELHL